MHEYVGAGQEFGESLAVRVDPQVEPGGPLAQHDLRDNRRLVPIGRVDTQHLGAPPGHQPSRDRSGQHPRQVQHPHPGERTSRSHAAKIETRRHTIGRLVEDERFGADCSPLWMAPPLLDRMDRRSRAAGGHHCLLQIVRRPAAHSIDDGTPLLPDTEHPQDCGSMPLRVGVQPNPPVGSLVVTGDRVPDWRQLPAVGPKRRVEPMRRQLPINRDRSGPALVVFTRQSVEADASGGDGGNGEVTDPKRGRQRSRSHHPDARRQPTSRACSIGDRRSIDLSAGTAGRYRGEHQRDCSGRPRRWVGIGTRRCQPQRGPCPGPRSRAAARSLALGESSNVTDGLS